MLLPYTQRIDDANNFDYQLAQMLNEPHTDMKHDMNLHDQENWMQYTREDLKKAAFVSGPHFWNDKNGRPYVTLMFEVDTLNAGREPEEGRQTVV